jgi:hypothetical protein
MIILVLIKLQLSDVIIFLNIYLEISIFVNFNIHVFKLVNDSHLRDEIASHIRRNYDFFLFTQTKKKSNGILSLLFFEK